MFCLVLVIVVMAMIGVEIVVGTWVIRRRQRGGLSRDRVAGAHSRRRYADDTMGETMFPP